MPQHMHEHDGLPPHETDTVHDRDTAMEQESTATERESTATEREATATAAVTVAPAPGGVATRIVLTILGAAGMIIGAFLAWVEEGVRGTELEFRVFFSSEGGSAGLATSAGLVLIILGLMALLGLAFRNGWLTSLAGALGLVAIILFAVVGAGGGIGSLDLGAWICALGSLIVLIAGWFGARDRVVAAG